MRITAFSVDSGGESFDALKYSAPKEPKKKKTSSMTSESTASAEKDEFKLPSKGGSAKPGAAAAAAKTPGPSKILSPASVRLYRVNPHTRAYEAMDNGNPLGCVIMGTGIQYQILIYNAQVSTYLSPSYLSRNLTTPVSFRNNHKHKYQLLQHLTILYVIYTFHLVIHRVIIGLFYLIVQKQ